MLLRIDYRLGNKFYRDSNQYDYEVIRVDSIRSFSELDSMSNSEQNELIIPILAKKIKTPMFNLRIYSIVEAL